MRNFVSCLPLLFVVGACTETPDSFPPCVYTAPCPDQDAATDGDSVATDGDSAATDGDSAPSNEADVPEAGADGAD